MLVDLIYFLRLFVSLILSDLLGKKSKDICDNKSEWEHEKKYATEFSVQF